MKVSTQNMIAQTFLKSNKSPRYPPSSGAIIFPTTIAIFPTVDPLSAIKDLFFLSNFGSPAKSLLLFSWFYIVSNISGIQQTNTPALPGPANANPKNVTQSSSGSPIYVTGPINNSEIICKKMQNNKTYLRSKIWQHFPTIGALIAPVIAAEEKASPAFETLIWWCVSR